MIVGGARGITRGLLLRIPLRIRTSPEAFRLAQSVGWATAGAVCSRSLALLSSFFAARILGRQVFGEWGIIQSTANLYGTFGQLGGLTAIKHVAEFRRTDSERAGRMIAVSIFAAIAGGGVVSLLMLLTSSWAARMLAAPELQHAVAVSSVAVFLILLNETLDGVLSGLEAFRTRSRVQFVAGITSFPLVVSGIHWLGLIGAVWGLIATQIVQALLTSWAIRAETGAAGFRIRWREAGREIRVLASFSLPTWCSGAVYVPSTWIANMILVNGAGGYAEMGLFNAADRWRTAILFLPSMLGAVTLPMLASLRGEGAGERYQHLLWSNVGLSALASLIVAAPIALLAPWIMARFGPGFVEGAWVLVTLCITSVAFSAYWLIGQSMISGGHVWTLFLFNLGWGVTLVTTEFALRGFGAKGLALAYLLADLIRLAAAFTYANRMRLSSARAQAHPRPAATQPAILSDAS